MSIETLTVPDAEVAKILGVREGHFYDMKARPIKPAKLTKTLSAFANADGGEMYIGIDEADGHFTWNGFSDPEDANGHLQIFEQLFPLGDGFQYSFLTNDSVPGFVLYILVHRSAQIRKASDGVIYLRRGAQNLPCASDEQIRQLERDKGITTFETELVPIELESITTQRPSSSS